MDDPPKPPWFGPKTIGYGWGPRTWQGYVVVLVCAVVFGAAVGTAAGRTVTIGHGTRKVTMGPTVVPGGGALTFTVAER